MNRKTIDQELKKLYKNKDKMKPYIPCDGSYRTRLFLYKLKLLKELNNMKNKRIKKVINYIRKLYKEDKILQIFFNHSCEPTKLIKKIDDCEIWLERFWMYIDVIGLTKEEEQIIIETFDMDDHGSINLTKEQ